MYAWRADAPQNGYGDAIKAQVDRFCFVSPSYGAEPRALLAEKIISLMPDNMGKVFFTNAGADANENAVKIARLFTGRNKVFSRYRSYHGSSFGAGNLTGEPRRYTLELGVPGFVKFFDPYVYREAVRFELEEAATSYYLTKLEEQINYENPSAIAAIVLETITGSNGVLIPPKGYMPGVRALCDKYGILMIVDEVMTGWCRTGKMFGFEHFDVKPDIVTFAKGVTCSLTLSAPPALTAATGMDTLTHAAEAFTSKKATPLTDLYALDAIRRILASLPRAYRDGGNAEARNSMAIAAYEAGVCISNASVTLVHGMSRPIGAKFHVPHGLSNAMLLTHCLGFAAAGRPQRFALLARGVGAAPEDADDTDAARALIEAFGRLTVALEVPTLAGYGIPEADFCAAIPQMAREAVQSGSPGNTLRDATEEDIVRLYESLY